VCRSARLPPRAGRVVRGRDLRAGSPAGLAEPGRRVLAAAGDGAFLTSSQGIETALRERIPLTVLISQDDPYGLIRWKMDLELGRDVATGFSSPIS